MKRIVPIACLITLSSLFTILGVFTSTKKVFACYANPLPNAKVGDSIKNVLHDLLDNGGCGEQLITMRYDEKNNTNLCAFRRFRPADGT